MEMAWLCYRDPWKAGQRVEAGFQGLNQLRQASTPKPQTRGRDTKLLKQVASFLRKAAYCP